MSQADSAQSAPIELLVRSREDQLRAPSPDDRLLVTAASELIADVVIVAVVEALDDENARLRDLPHQSLRYAVSEHIRLIRHGWGSWEALFAVPPDTVVWAIHEINQAIPAALIVRVGERAINRLRSGDVDRDLIEGELVERESTFDLYFPNGKSFLEIRRRSSRTRYRGRQIVKAQTKGAPTRTVRTYGRKGRKPKRK